VGRKRATDRLWPALAVLILLPASGWGQEISVRGGTGLNVFIGDGDTTPRTTDGTSFGSANVTGGTINKTRIQFAKE